MQGATVLPGHCRVSVDEDGMKAWLEIKPDAVITYRSAGADNQPGLTPETAPVYRNKACVDLSGVFDLLKRHGVVFGILRTHLEDIVEQAQEGLFLVAMGVEPTLPIDEEVEIHFRGAGKGKPVVSADGGVDYYELQSFPSVTGGEVLARKKPGIPGRDGKKVTGEVVPAAPPARVFLDPGPGVELIDDGQAAVSTIDGKPEVIRRGRVYWFSVSPVLEIRGDVSLKTGNVRFKGDVRIDGSVNEGMQVRAQGDIEVHGLVTGATLEAQGDVIVHGAVASSEITAGTGSEHMEQYVKPLDKLINHLGKAILAARDLMSAAQDRGREISAGPALDAVIQRKYAAIPALIRELDGLCRRAAEHRRPLPGQLKDAVESAVRMFLYGPIADSSLKAALNLLSRLRFAAGELAGLARPRGNVFMHAVSNTFVDAGRSIHVTGRGAYTSVMHAGENLVIDGALRGGSLTVNGGVVINQAGSSRGLGTAELHLSTGSSARINTAFPELIIRVGPRSRTIRQALHNVRVRYDNRTGRIEVDGVPVLGLPTQEN